MKKHLSFALAALLAVGALASNVSAIAGNASWGDVPKTADKIVLDGKKDEIYDQALKVAIENSDNIYAKDGKATASGTAYYIHDDEYIYFLIEVSDSELVPNDTAKQSGSYWECDGVEICYDFANDGKNLSKWTCWYEGEYMNKSSAAVTDAEYKTTLTDGGYIIEHRTKLPDGVKSGSDIGVNIILDNMTSGGRVLVRAPQSTGATENELGKYDVIHLSDKAVTAKKVAASAQTADPIALTVLAAAASVAGVVVSKKRK